VKQFWTQQENDFLVLHYADKPMSFLLAGLPNRTEGKIYQHAATLGLKKSQEYLDSEHACRLRRGDNIGKEYRFKKGNVPFNKGVKGVCYEGTKATQFVKGSRPPNYKPVGTIRKNRDGQYEMKMAEGMYQWKLLNRVIWERCNGKIPKGHVVKFIDGDYENLEVTNLLAISKAQNMVRNSYHNYPKEISQLIQLKGAITRQINKRGNHEQLRNA
jgi:hypothetical protein